MTSYVVRLKYINASGKFITLTFDSYKKAVAEAERLNLTNYIIKTWTIVKDGV